ncbi:sce7726 family protein [Acinetobacter ursingii]|uniref:sce7726 family protein n=1 Tax=Acinetobacter ursingii TaxID=108980 RepID=UPI003008BF60
MNATNDQDIRHALHSRLQKQYYVKDDHLVIDELSLEHGRNRVDIAVFDSCIHGYEIKSSKDNLLRLQNQLSQYSKSLQKVTFVVAENHFKDVMISTPEWCGLILVTKGPRGGVSFRSMRRAKLNPNVDFFSLAHILWKSEAIDLLYQYGVTERLEYKTRKELYKQLNQVMTVQQLALEIKTKLLKRGNWRADEQPLSYDD